MFRNFIKSIPFRGSTSRKLSGTAEAGVEAYAGSVQLMHWLSGGAILACVGTVLASQNSKDNKFKGKMMFIHKSFGTLALGLIAPRILLRLMSKAPGHLPGLKIENLAADASHVALYGFAIFMPVSGVAMGYYGGKGLPFFFTTLPGAAKADGAIAKQAYTYHKLAGKALEYLVPIHVGGALVHVFKGHKIFARITPFKKI